MGRRLAGRQCQQGDNPTARGLRTEGCSAAGLLKGPLYVCNYECVPAYPNTPNCNARPRNYQVVVNSGVSCFYYR